MIVKGIVSAIYPDNGKISVILPEYENMTTKPMNIYGHPNLEQFHVNEFVLVMIFNEDFNDGIILSKSSSSDGGESYNFGSGLLLDENTNTVSVDTAKDFEGDNTRPVEANFMETIVGNIEILLETI